MKTLRNGLKVAQFIGIQPRLMHRNNSEGFTGVIMTATG